MRAWSAQTNGGSHDAWNIWYRSFLTGDHVDGPAKIPYAISGAEYKSAAGFQEFYGDYGEVAITSAGKTFGV